jgi:hypothetical protein
MTIDYIVSSLPALAFNSPAPITWEKFAEICGGEDAVSSELNATRWADIETQLRNALVEARGGAEKFKRPADGCSVYWKKRVLDCFSEADVAKRDELLDRVWWDAAGELADVASPLGRGALAAYAARLKIAIRRTAISKDEGNAAFDRLTATTKEAI